MGSRNRARFRDAGLEAGDVCHSRSADGDRRSHAQAAEGQMQRDSHYPPARITLLYESNDGRFCLFEDAEGHLAAVRAARLV